MPTKFGRQPFMDVLAQRDLPYREVAKKVKVPYLHFRHAGYGYVSPKEELRQGLAEYLKRPVSELFTGEALAAVPHYGHRARKLMIEARVPGRFALATREGLMLAEDLTLDEAIEKTKTVPDQAYELISQRGRTVAVIRNGSIKDIDLNF